ncbi:MAG: hypothetical protein KF762_10425 [Acidobacteria bacterium]|nr:hypothetical protein [Acidobacteriota bacterium]
MNDSGRTRLEIWNCRGCGVVHIAAGNVRLDLNREEFEAFAEAVVGIYCGQLATEAVPLERSNDGRMDIFRGALTSSEVH